VLPLKHVNKSPLIKLWVTATTQNRFEENFTSRSNRLEIVNDELHKKRQPWGIGTSSATISYEMLMKYL
jgi:hypothetical protein